MADGRLATLSSYGGSYGEPDDDGHDARGDGAGALPARLSDSAVGGAVQGTQEGLLASSSASTIAVGRD